MPDGSFRKMAGVTKVCHIIDKSEVLMPWAVKKAMEKLKRLLAERRLIVPVNADDVFVQKMPLLYETLLDEIIQSAKRADSEELEAAAEIGHIAHGWIEDYIRATLAEQEDRRIELLAKLPVEERAAKACIAACCFMDAHNVRWIGTERKAFSRTYEYAGTMDGLALVDSCSDRQCCPTEFKDRLTLVDWKTSNYLYIEYLLQTAAYQQAYQEETGEKIEDRWIIRLGKDDAEFDPWHMEGEELFNEDLAAFLNALNLSRSVEALDARIEKITSQKKAIRLAIEAAEREAANKIACPDSAEYKGVRKKKGCNKTDQLCKKCETIFLQKQEEKNG